MLADDARSSGYGGGGGATTVTAFSLDVSSWDDTNTDGVADNANPTLEGSLTGTNLASLDGATVQVGQMVAGVFTSVGSGQLDANGAFSVPTNL